jgi:cell division protein FtsQ
VATRKRKSSRATAFRLPRSAVRIALVAASAVLLVLVAYVAARGTSLFAVRTLSISGGSPRARAEAKRALRDELGRSLLRIDEHTLSTRLDALPDVVSATFDRSFPHTLHVRLRSERAVLLIRQGSTASWVVSSRGRVMRRLSSPKRSSLPRLWLPKSVALKPGETLRAADGGLAAAAVAPIVGRAYRGGVRTVTSSPGSITLVLRRGPQIRLGDIGDLRLKLAIAGKILQYSGAHATTPPAYVDVSVPERPVLLVGQG